MPHGNLKAVEAPGNERLVILTGILTLGAAGAITTSDCVGFSAVQTATKTGRYTLTPTNKFLKLMYGNAVIEGDTDAAAAAGKGQTVMLRNVNSTTPKVEIQVMTPSLAAGASVDVLPETNAKIRIFMVFSRGKI